MFKIDGLNLAV